MKEARQICSECGASILQTTADRNNGLCEPCVKEIKRVQEEEQNKPMLRACILIYIFAILTPSLIITGIVTKNCIDAEWGLWILLMTPWTFFAAHSILGTVIEIIGHFITDKPTQSTELADKTKE